VRHEKLRLTLVPTSAEKDFEYRRLGLREVTEYRVAWSSDSDAAEGAGVGGEWMIAGEASWAVGEWACIWAERPK
jgi:hypothetical protein